MIASIDLTAECAERKEVTLSTDGYDMSKRSKEHACLNTPVSIQQNNTSWRVVRLSASVGFCRLQPFPMVEGTDKNGR